MSFSYIANRTVFQRNLINNFLKTCGYLRNTYCVQMSPWSNLMYKNPTLDLQQFLEISVFNNEKYFEPTPDSMRTALELFVPRDDHVINCITRAVYPEKFPSHNVPEVALLGQSNAGKSTLLKAVFQYAPELRIQTSKNPGHTKSLSFYQVGKHFCLVDMPGYGYRQPKWFESSVMNYLKNRENLAKTFILIDCQRGFNSWDDSAVQMVTDMKIPFAIILTKIDKVPDSERLKSFLHIKNLAVTAENACFPQIFMLSSLTYEGLAYFMSFVAHITGNLNIEKKA